MKVLIVESEIYLAQSIGTKLSEIGYVFDVVSNVKDAIKNEFFDVVLLSTTLYGQDFYPVIEHYKNSIIILLNSYINNDTVAIPLSKGAKDYILKPFMMEELIRKIKHFQEYEKIQKDNIQTKEYLEFILKDIEIDEKHLNKHLPLVVQSSKKLYCDKFVYKYSKLNKLVFEIIDLSSKAIKIENLLFNTKQFYYFINFNSLKQSEKLDLLDNLSNKKNFIILSSEKIENLHIDTVEIYSDDGVFDSGNILSIDDYVKNMIINYQDTFPDTELSKKLGISRKSLWEKRKKYGINKKK